MVLESLVAEMDERISIGEEECQKLPFLVCVIDEFDDTIASIEEKEDEQRFIASINSIIRRGRKAKVILILASHDPTLKNTKVNINGIIPRITFRCATYHNSVTAIGVTGAENLPGEGAMLFKSQDESIPIPLQGSFITQAEIEEVLANPPAECGDITMLKTVEHKLDGDMGINVKMPEKDRSELARILFWTLGRGKVSALQIQEEFRMGNRVADIMETLYQMGIITAKFYNQPRVVLPTSIEELSSEAVSLLEHYGYDKELVQSTLDSTDKESV